MVEAAHSQYGSVQGPIRHGKVKFRESLHVASGVRYANFKPASRVNVNSVSSFVKFFDGAVPFVWSTRDSRPPADFAVYARAMTSAETDKQRNNLSPPFYLLVPSQPKNQHIKEFKSNQETGVAPFFAKCNNIILYCTNMTPIIKSKSTQMNPHLCRPWMTKTVLTR